MSGTQSLSHLHFPDSDDEVPKLNSEDSLDEYLEKSAQEQVDDVVSKTDGEHLPLTNYITSNSTIWHTGHEFIYKNPGTDVVISDDEVIQTTTT
jgi:hypothetical protein